ncbi:MAG: hypothetical protein K8S16_07415 [Bacteroidales bacterium]|nr:hypothetical protein [Bacteroidales bacterium]
MNPTRLFDENGKEIIREPVNLDETPNWRKSDGQYCGQGLVPCYLQSQQLNFIFGNKKRQSTG